MSKFIREDRYIVIKRTDVEKYLSSIEKEYLKMFMKTINEKRILVKNKPIINAVVVKQDWPEYKEVWKMIEKRELDNNKSKLDNK